MEFDPEDEEASAMAAAMGFSSFGSHKPPAKKRKFNPTTDAFVEGQDLEKIDRGGKKGTGSGGNTMPLGKTRVLGKPKEVGRNSEDEIDLDADKDEGGPQYEDSSRIPPTEDNLDDPRDMDMSLPRRTEQTDGAHEQGPAYIDTSEEAPAAATVPEAEKAEMQARIDAILASIESAPPPPGSETLPLHSISGGLPPPLGLSNKPVYSDTSFMQGSPRGHGRGAFSDAGSMASSRGGRGGRNHGGRGQHNKNWYEDYYDPSFNENPWAKLERVKGLQPVGTWIERPEKEKI